MIGRSVSMSNDGNTSGYSVALSGRGTRVVIGATHNDSNGRSNSGHVRVYEWRNSKWNKVGVDVDGDHSGDMFGRDVAIQGL